MSTPTTGPRPTTPARILVVEDGPGEREALVRVLQLEGYEVLAARDPATAMMFVDRPIDLVISDLRMGKQTGLDLLQMWRERHPTTPFIIVTAYGEVESAVNAMKLGARDYLSKPIDPGRLLNLVHKCIADRAKGGTRPGGEVKVTVERLLGESTAMRQVREQVLRAAAAESIVLVTGESGTGKELTAQAIHYHSPRAAGPLITVNMAAVPESAVESELFGHPRTPGSDAADRPGCFEAADGGTLFIDEVGDFPLHAQARLLRVLETRIVQRPGGDAERAVDVRLVAATSRDLRRMVQEQTFRSDLFYRLNVVSIALPPLRERREDIPLLTDHYVQTISRTLDKSPPQLSADLLAFLYNYDWPGNVRELRNCLESMIVLTSGDRLNTTDLPAGIADAATRDSAPTSPEDESRLDSLEKSVILQTLKRFDGNRTRTAHELGISVRTLQRRLKLWGINTVET